MYPHTQCTRHAQSYFDRDDNQCSNPHCSTYRIPDKHDFWHMVADWYSRCHSVFNAFVVWHANLVCNSDWHYHCNYILDAFIVWHAVLVCNSDGHTHRYAILNAFIIPHALAYPHAELLLECYPDTQPHRFCESHASDGDSSGYRRLNLCDR